MKTEQEIFDITRKHIEDQGGPSYNGGCMYQFEGRGCGAAPFIWEYRKEMEGRNWGWLVKRSPESLDPDSLEHLDLISSLQTCHDFNAETFGGNDDDFMTAWREDMQKLAGARGLIW